MSGTAAFEKRLETLSRAIGNSRARTIAIRIPTLLTPHARSVESVATVAPETQAEVDEILQALNVTDEDMVITVCRFYSVGDEPASIAPELLSVR
jgi:hypothetical protein